MLDPDIDTTAHFCRLSPRVCEGVEGSICNNLLARADECDGKGSIGFQFMYLGIVLFPAELVMSTSMNVLILPAAIAN